MREKLDVTCEGNKPYPGRTIQVGTLEDAVELAATFKKEGRYDWFRGQSEEWSPDPTLVRLDEDGRKVADERWSRFAYWVHKTSGLEELRKDSDLITAVAQHYGIPTMYLDFTTDPGVAGFFAASTKPDPNVRGCIFCLETRELAEHWKLLSSISKQYYSIDLVANKVPNLWRLEAQHGVFLYCPGNWNLAYGMVRITFPQCGPPSFPTKDQIYPSKKSQLEILLDHYFKSDRHAGWYDMAKKYFPEAKELYLEDWIGSGTVRAFSPAPMKISQQVSVCVSRCIA